MLTSKAVIQKIDAATCSVRLYQNFDLRSPWSFSSHQQEDVVSPNPQIFPFVFHGPDEFSEGRAGPETRVQRRTTSEILFADDYGVPGGFLIGVLFPKGYVPEVLKFKSKPFIPTGMGSGGASMAPPGHFEVFYNQPAQRSAVAFLVHQPTFFGFKCVAIDRADSFPSSGEHPFLSDLHASLGFAESHPVTVKVEDLEHFKEQFAKSVDLDELANLLNQLFSSVATDNYAEAEKAMPLVRKLQEALATTASAVQLSDSYLSGGTIAAVARLISYLAI